MQHNPYGPYEKYIKRPLDCFLSLFALVTLFPIIGVIAILVRIKLGFPIFFIQERPGKNEKIFKLYKFRTMTNKVDENGNLLPDAKRLTRFGIFLRSTSLDELPELINIIKGDMALIGPRPLLIQYLPYYTEIEKIRHSIRPGLSGLAQVNGRNYINWDKRLALDVEYVNKITFWGDICIFFSTITNVFGKKDVAVDTESAHEGYLDQIRKDVMKN